MPNRIQIIVETPSSSVQTGGGTGGAAATLSGLETTVIASGPTTTTTTTTASNDDEDDNCYENSEYVDSDHHQNQHPTNPKNTHTSRRKAGNDMNNNSQMGTGSTTTTSDDNTSCDGNNKKIVFDLESSPALKAAGGGEPLRSKFLVTKLSGVGDQDSVNNLTESQEIPLMQPAATDDAVPELDNYRNILSLTGNARPRPTLHELRNSAACILNNSNREVNLKNYVLELDEMNESRVGGGDEVKIESGRGEKKTAASIVAGSRATLQQHAATNKSGIVKFGWIQGVLIRCILNIFGVMIFLRVSWLVGQAGLGLISIIIIIATMVTFITALSMSAICTNGEVRGGGAYYLISRSLGPEFGGAIGIVFSFANAVAAAMYVIGFCETLVKLLESYGVSIFGLGETNQIRVLGLGTNLILVLIALIGMGWESKVQLFLLGILLISFANFLIGSFIPPGDEKRAKGFIGYKFENLVMNFGPDFRDGEDFAHLFGVFFPAVTGILAGANISGNLKDPQKSIPQGTLLSIILTSATYLLFSWICGATIVRDATGNTNDLINGSFILKCTDQKCNYGLMNHYGMMSVISFWAPIITAGIFSASLSSALASLVSGPKVFQAVCQDKIFPYIEYFGKGHGKGNEPWRGYFLTFIISSAFIGLGELNTIAPIISNFFLMSYALVNYSCFDASLAKTPGWRPAFKYYNKWVSLFGALLCVSIMFLIEWWAALVTFVAITALHVYVKQRKPEINWGSSTQAHIYRRSLDYSLKLVNIEEHVKNFRPNFLVLTGAPTERPALCDLSACLAKNRCLMICANVLDEYNDLRPIMVSEYYKWLRNRKIKSFYTEVTSSSLRVGVSTMMQCTGVGKLKPNTLILGFKNNWSMEKVESVLDYYEMINDAFLYQYGICIMRLEGGLDYSELLDDVWNDNGDNKSESEESDLDDAEIHNKHDAGSDQPVLERTKNIEHLILHQTNHISNEKESKANNTSVEQEPLNVINHHASNLNLKKSFLSSSDMSAANGVRRGSFLKSTDVIKLRNTKINSGALQGLNIFHRKHQSGYVDVWWMFDDGGLSILLPYLLKQRKYWRKCKLRIFIQTKASGSDVSEEQRNMATLLSKFRIEFHDLIVFSTSNRKPQASTISMYEKLIENWRLKSNESAEMFPWKITESMYKQNLDKINQHLVLKELLTEYSQNSTFIFITITVPTRHSTCAPLWLSLLDIISSQMPPVLMVRGNQTSVLTYYS